MDNFSEWLAKEMKDRNLSQAELARRSGVSQASISLVLNGVRGPGPDLCTAIAIGMKMPTTTVFKAAGLLPVDRSRSPLVEEALFILEHLHGEDIEDALRYLRMRLDVAEKRSAERGSKRKAGTTSP